MEKKSTTKKITVIAIFSALAFLLQMLGSLIGLKIGGFLEIEISDIPALIISFAYGPVSGLAVEFFKNLLHCPFTSTGFIGELANFLVNGMFVFSAGALYKFNKSKKSAALSMLTATVIMTASAFLINLFLMLPLYMPSADFSAKYNIALTVITPFNAVKGILISGLTFLLYKRVVPIIREKS